MTIAEKWFAEGEAKGRIEGEAKGRAEAKAEMLRRLLLLKFGTAAGQAESTIAGANEVELECWLERVLTAPTLSAVFVP